MEAVPESGLGTSCRSWPEIKGESSASEFSILIYVNQVILGFTVLFCTCGTIVAEDSPPQVAIVRLETPVYPPMALAARVSGDVNLDITLAPVGTAANVAVRSGPPMLTQAAIDSAKRSQFRAIIDKPGGAYEVTYRFQLDQPTKCERDSSYPRLQYELDLVTITEQPALLCDPAVVIERIRFRSAKCLYLWKCGSKTQ